MKSLPALLALALLPAALKAEHDDTETAALQRAVFDNRSSSAVTVYQRSSFYKFEAVKRVGAGEAFATPTEEGDEWLVSTPVYYRPVEYLKVSGRDRRAVITDSDLSAIGSRKLAIKWVNRTGGGVDLYKVVGREAVHWSRLSRGEVKSIASYSGRDWVVRESGSGRQVRRYTCGDSSGSVNLEPAASGFGFRDRWPDGAGTGSIELTISNRSARTISVSKRTRFGSRTFGQVGAWQTARVDTTPGEVWRLEDAGNYDVLDTITVLEDRGDCTLLINSSGKVSTRWTGSVQPHTPPPPQKVELRVENETPGRIDVYRFREGAYRHAKRISVGSSWTLEYEVGQRGNVREVESSRVLESFTAPSRDWTLKIKDPVAEAEAEAERERAEAEATQERSGPPRPRELLRRIFGN